MRTSAYEIAALCLACFACSCRSGPRPDASKITSPSAVADAEQQVLRKYNVEQLHAVLESRHRKTLSRSEPTELRGMADASIASYIILKQKTIYNTDWRSDYCDIRDPRKLVVANSVAALVTADHFMQTQDRLQLVSRTLGSEFHLCTGEAFYSQPVAAFCTAFVAGADVLITAGRCVGEINSARVVFGFNAERRHGDQLTFTTDFPAAEIYTPIDVISRQVGNDLDFALIRVDRPMVNHPPLPLHLDGPVSVGASVYVVGHPSGLPLKMADHAFVRSVSNRGYFVSNLDTFGGNSGSPVLNANTNEVEGVLVRGDTDYQRQDQCQVAFVCPSGTGCRGEEATLISALKDQIQQTKGSVSRPQTVTRIFSSGPKLSGSRKDSSPEYVLYSDPAPPGYRIASFSYSLAGDRACNAFSSCVAAIEADRVAFRFTLQGHDEWPPPGQAMSEGNLVVTYSPIR